MGAERAHPFDDWPALREAVERYATDHGWSRRTCSCGRTHYYKRGNDETCGTDDCLGAYRFLDRGQASTPRFPLEVWDDAREWFDARGYAPVSPAPVENETGTTYLAVAGVQAFDDVFFEGAPAPDGPAVVAQPAVRSDAREAVGRREGITSSFVNLATVRPDADDGPAACVADLDAWLDLLSHLGLFVSDCSLVVDAPTVEDWGTGAFEKYALRLTWDGLELGELGVLRGVPRGTRAPLTVVDCGFSLERVAWALTRTSAFAPVLGPLRAAAHHPVAYLDAVRTATLLAAGGVTPGPDGAGYRLRQLVGAILAADPTGDCTELVRHYHAFWSAFASLSGFEATRATLRRELDRQYNRRAAGLPNAPDADAETEAFLRTLLERGNAWEDVRAAATDGRDG